MGLSRPLGISILLLILAPCVLAGSGSEAGPATGSNQVIGVKPFPLDLDSGSMALHALATCLEFSGRRSTYDRLVAVSGAGFKFVYDTTEAYEPLRDLYPLDVLKMGANASGFADAHWELDKPIEEVKELVKREIDRGRPMITPFLKSDAYHGFFLITGYDFSDGFFYLQGALRDSVYARVPIPPAWSGPTASPMGWAVNPIFILGGTGEGPQPTTGLDKSIIATGIDMLKGGTLTYGLTEGEMQYLRSPGPHRATYGLPAYRLVSRDIETAGLTVSRNGEDAFNFSFVWRLDSQLGQLVHDRGYAASAVTYLIPRVSSGKSIEVEELVSNIERTVADAKALRKIFWDQIPDTARTAEGVAAYVKGSESMVFSFAGRDRFLEALRDLGLQAFKTAWGPVIVADSPAKRMRAKIIVKSLQSREKASLNMMEEIVGYVAEDLGVQPQEPTGPAKRRKQ